MYDFLRQEKEAELRLLEEETALRVEEAIRKKVEEALASDEVKQRIMKKFEDGKRRLFENVNKQLELEKIAALDEARKKEVSPSERWTGLFQNVIKIICI
jgi:arginine/glutamate-rich protein 1